jgi:hypothetical protein
MKPAETVVSCLRPYRFKSIIVAFGSPTALGSAQRRLANARWQTDKLELKVITDEGLACYQVNSSMCLGDGA